MDVDNARNDKKNRERLQEKSILPKRETSRKEDEEDFVKAEKTK